METQNLNRMPDSENGYFMSFGNNQMERRFALGSIFVTFLLLFAVAALLKNLANSTAHPIYAKNTISTVSELASYAPASSRELLQQLKEQNLWDISPQTEISPVILASYPHDLKALDLPKKKRAFLHSLLPVVMLALAEVDQERTTLLSILGKISQETSLGTLNLVPQDWSNQLTASEIEFLIFITRKYRTRNVPKLLRRVNILPVSLVLAQAAIESSWGSSRFVTEGNNLFGMWTWGEKGIVPSRRDEGENHKVASYPSILESVRAYILTLNRFPAYKTFRDIRQHTMGSLELADGLLYYSERRNAYIRDVKEMILVNNLKKYDTHVFATRIPIDETARINLTFLNQGKNVVL